MRPAWGPHGYTPDGICQLCGKGDLEKFRRRWHNRCFAIGSVAIFPAYAFAWLRRRQRGRCAGCDIEFAPNREPWNGRNSVDPPIARMFESTRSMTERVELDHIVPLWKVAKMPLERQTIRWWLAGNLQLLCVPCHRAKTALEAKELGLLRRKPTPQLELKMGEVA
jgi:hypothetical protein